MTITCPDCGAAFDGRPLAHSETCPIGIGYGRAQQADANWFRQRRGATHRRRPITWAERQDLLITGMDVPVSADLIVTEIRPGLRAKRLAENPNQHRSTR